MSKSRRKLVGGGSREERRRSRERASEARRRREELEKRAAMLVGEPAPKQEKRAEAKSEKGAKPPAEGKRSKPPKRARNLPDELSQRFSLPKLGRGFAVALRPLGWLLRRLAWLIFWLAARVEQVLKFLLGRAAPPLAAFVAWLGRMVTPYRMAVVLIFAAAAAVLASQLIDYRAIAIGEEAYADVVSLAHAPLTNHETPWVAHGPLVGMLALVAAAGALLGLRTSSLDRPRQIALAAVAGGLLVVLAIDLPRAGDLDAASSEYAGTDGVLLKGFYIQLVSLILLAYTALLPILWRLRPEALPLTIKRGPARATERKSTA